MNRGPAAALATGMGTPLEAPMEAPMETSMPDETDTLATSPKDAATGAVRPNPEPGDRPGTEAQARAGTDGAPREAAPDAVPAGERNSAYRGADARR